MAGTNMGLASQAPKAGAGVQAGGNKNAVVELKKLMPYRARVGSAHVVNLYGTGLTETQRADMIKEINRESLAAVEWGRVQVKKKMMYAMARVGLKVEGRHAKKFTDIKDSLRHDTSDANIARIYEICYGDYEGEEAKGWSSSLENKYMREMCLEYRCKPNSLRDKGGIEMCITKAKVDTVSKVWGTKDGTSLVLSLKGENGLPPKMIEDRKKAKELIQKREAKAPRRRNGEFYLKKKGQGRGIWRMLYQGLDVPLLKLGTIMEHGDGRDAAEEEAEATENGGSVDNSQDYQSSSTENGEEGDTDTTDKGLTKAGSKRAANETTAVAGKKKKMAQAKDGSLDNIRPEAQGYVQDYRERMTEKDRVDKKQTDKDEQEKRKKEMKRKEEKEELDDKEVLDASKLNKKKGAATNKKQTKKPAKASGAEKKILERVELAKRKAAEKEEEIEARRKKLIAEGVTPRILEEDTRELGEDDMEWESDQWEVVGHAVEWSTGKANFKVVTGMRSGDGGATQMWTWGQRQALLLDGFNRSVLEKYIDENCEHQVYREVFKRVVKIKTPLEPAKAKKKEACNHSSFSLGLSYHADPEVNPGWCVPGKFLFGVECAGCGSPFVQKAPPAVDGGGKQQRGDPQVPSATNGVYCCNNLRNRNGGSDDGCSHAYCRHCWDEGLLEASKSGVRASRRA